MDIFRFNFGEDFWLQLTYGEYINGIRSIVWTERYAEPGEFEIQAPLSSDIRAKLPIGCLISHVDTPEIMMVENHEIKEQKEGEETMISITGRSLLAFLEARIIGNQDARQYGYIQEYVLDSSQTPPWQIQLLINDNFSGWANTDDGVAGFRAFTYLPAAVPPYETALRVVPKGDVLKAVLELLSSSDLGIRTIRRGWAGRQDPLDTPAYSEWNILEIHEGENKINSVIFSWKSGDLDAINYLFSNKKTKNAAIVVGRYMWVNIDDGDPFHTDYFRRQMVVDGSDIDEGFTEPPVGVDYDAVRAKMIERGRIAISTQNNIVLGQTDVSEVTNYQYRRDYNVGDLVALDANFEQIAVMRVIEYTEIKDENGESGHPTLALPFGEATVGHHILKPDLGGFVVQKKLKQ